MRHNKRELNRTYSVRKAEVGAELWLNYGGRWGIERNRQKFPSQAAAEQFVIQQFGKDFHRYGLFPNS